jgi:ABC-type antimicrobial peptide transport system permease subunit
MRSLESLLYQVNPRDPIVFIGVGLGLGVIALIAACIPARRAATADPLVAMRPD